MHIGTVAKCLFVIVRIEIDNQYLFIVHRFRLRIDLILGFVHRLFSPNFSTPYDKLLYSPIRLRQFGKYNIAKCPPEGDPPLAEKV